MLLTEEGEDPGGRHVEFVGSGKKEHVSNTVGIKLLKYHLDDLLPLLLVDHLHQTTPGHHQVEQLVQVEHLFCHDWKPVDRSSWGDSI